jgi:DMSO/TMAO reductase YedYZ heme-binding membrane subunit
LIDESYLHLLSGIAFFAGSTVLAYFSAKSKGRIRQLAIIFLVFTVIHSLYHVAFYFGYELLSEGLLEPVSIIVLIFFGLYYLLVKSKQEVRQL